MFREEVLRFPEPEIACRSIRVGVTGMEWFMLTSYAKETREDDAVNKVLEQAALDASARMAHRDPVLPDITMREGQKHFAAASETGTGVNGAKVNLIKEPLMTEADIVAPAAGVEAGDRTVDPKQVKCERGFREITP